MPDRDIGFNYDRWLDDQEDRAMQDTDDPDRTPTAEDEAAWENLDDLERGDS